MQRWMRLIASLGVSPRFSALSSLCTHCGLSWCETSWPSSILVWDIVTITHNAFQYFSNNKLQVLHSYFEKCWNYEWKSLDLGLGRKNLDESQQGTWRWSPALPCGPVGLRNCQKSVIFIMNFNTFQRTDQRSHCVSTAVGSKMVVFLV